MLSAIKHFSTAGMMKYFKICKCGFEFQYSWYDFYFIYYQFTTMEGIHDEIVFKKLHLWV